MRHPHVRCTKCGEYKSRSEFYVAGPTQPQTYGGIRMPCKQCTRTHRNEYMHAYYQRPDVKERDRNYRRALYKKNPEIAKARVALFHKRHPDWLHERTVKRYRNDPRVRERLKEYLRTHPELRAVVKANRRTRETAGGKLTAKQWRTICKAYEYKCAYCGRECNPCLEHIIPVCKGGTNSMGNCVPACNNCNRRKNRMDLDDFLRRMAKEGIALHDPRVDSPVIH
jgi:5-methylcytosine-specific restriction endonuclease McrA